MNKNSERPFIDEHETRVVEVDKEREDGKMVKRNQVE